MRTRNCNEDRVSREHESIRILADGFNGEQLLEPETLAWGEDDILTLKEISDQLRKKGFRGVIYVWAEGGLSGRIYQYGNCIEVPYWVVHGQTNGYA